MGHAEPYRERRAHPKQEERTHRREEEWGAAFCYALNRLKLEQEGFRLGSGRSTSYSTGRKAPLHRPGREH